MESREHIAKQLRGVPILERFPDELLLKLASKFTEQSVNKDKYLFHKGDVGDALYLIQSGWVKIVVDESEGEEVVVNHCGPGEVIGELALIDGLPRSAGIVAIDDKVEFLRLDRDAFLEALNQHPKMAIDLMLNMANKLRFSLTYVEQAVHLCRQIAEGDYRNVLEQIRSTQETVIDLSQSDEERVNAFLSAFLEMVEEIQDREEILKEHIRMIIEIDEKKREAAVRELVESSYFDRIKSAASEFRALNKPDLED